MSIKKRPAAPLQLLPLKNDFVFKLVFGDQRRVALLTEFLQAVLDLPVDEYKKVTIVDPNVKKEYSKDKAGVLDVKIHTKTGNVIDVEIQIEPEVPLEKRIIYYQSKMIAEQISEGNDYDVIKKVISIIITDFALIPNSPAYHHRFRFYDSVNAVELTDIQEINVLELPKLPSKSDATDLFDWMLLIRAKNEEDYKMLVKKKPVFEKVVAIVKQLSADEQARMEYDQHELWRMDYAASIRNADRNGYARGQAKGEVERSITIARNMKAKGLDISLIAEMTELSPAQIKKLK
jgi:predicted transposase/invertase (TIGR01784 family)